MAKNKCINYIKDAIFFVLLLRVVSIYPFVKIPHINTIYVLFSRCAALLILIRYFGNILRKKSITKLAILILILFLWELLVTWVNNGDSIRRVIMGAYPNICMCLYIEMESKKRKKELLINLSSVLSILSLLNVVFQIFAPDFFGKYQYFLGGRNQFALIYIISFSLLGYLYSKKLKFICFFVYLFSIYLGGSVTSILAFLLLGCFELLPVFKGFINKCDYNFLFFIFVGFSILVSVFNVTRYFDVFITEILGRSSTLTSRVYIWENVVDEIVKSPIIGHGVQDTINSFHIYVDFANAATLDKYYSAHNQILQTIYEMGVIGISLLIFIVTHVIYVTKRDFKMNIFKNALLAVCIIFVCESPGIDSILLLLILMYYYAKFTRDNNKNLNRIR